MLYIKIARKRLHFTTKREMGKVFITWILVIQLLLTVVAQEECTVKIQNSTIFGKATDTIDPSRRVCSYTGIPFAAPPVGPLRFQAPQPPQPWGDEGLNATSPPNWCPQGSSPLAGGRISEDCLYLNVHVPKSSAKGGNNLPVMIWFHGGGFTEGSSDFYSPARLLARGDVILVTAHYRLGLLGFLSTGDASSPGNYGLKDQAYSIRWVGENIKAFGGDPDKVTVFGESAGGASAIFQLITPLNKGRVHGVIAQSGTVLSTWAIDRDPLGSAKFMAKRLGCPETPNDTLVTCMRNLSWESIVAEQGKHKLESYSMMRNAYATVTPVVEPDLPGAFISKEPLEIIKSGEIPNIPVMLGTTKHDGSFILGILYKARIGPLKLDHDPDYMRNSAVPEILDFFDIKEVGGNRAVASSLEMTYLAGVNRSSFNASMPGLVDIFSVFAFKSSILNTAELLAKRGLNVYLYSFEHHGHNSFWNIIGLQSTPVGGGVTHADDLIYMFNLPTLKLSKEDLSFADLFNDMWLNFGKTGNPTPTASDKYERWPPYNTIEQPFMKLNNTPTVLHDYRTSWRPNGFQWT